MSYHSQEYFDALNSSHWMVLKKQVLWERNHCCERCSEYGNLELHHKHYRTLGREGPEDVELLCSSCHEQADEERKTQTQYDRYNARLDGWACKVYGDDWESRMDPGMIESRFDAWLESKGYD